MGRWCVVSEVLIDRDGREGDEEIDAFIVHVHGA
jgi:hypothetical protein